MRKLILILTLIAFATSGTFTAPVQAAAVKTHQAGKKHKHKKHKKHKKHHRKHRKHKK